MTQVAIQRAIYNYECVGSGDKTPLLVLHGWGRTGSEWREMASALAAAGGCKVYLLDLPGFGGSSKQNIKNIGEYSEQVVAWSKYIGIDKATVIGHSLGGRVGIWLAAHHPRFVEKLILVDPAGIKPSSIKREVLRILSKIFSFVPVGIRRIIARPVMDDDYRSNPELRELYRAVVASDLKGCLKEIKCRTVLLWGELDPILPVELTKVYRSKIRDITVRIVWGAGHDPHLSHFEQTLRILEEYI